MICVIDPAWQPFADRLQFQAASLLKASLKSANALPAVSFCF